MNDHRHAGFRMLTSVLVAMLAGAVAFVVGVLAAVVIIGRRVVTPAPRRADTEILRIDTGAQTIDLSRSEDTELPGRYGLFTHGDHPYLKVGAVLNSDDGHVRRKLLTEVEPGARVDRTATFSGWYYTGPDELHLPWEAVLIGSSVGPCPAWLIPGAPTDPGGAGTDTWVIQVHGRGANRAECLRAVPPIQRLGMTSLVISYRNDGEAPHSRSGRYTLGASEWRDVDAAIAWARRRGARRIVLMGWSMGGAIVLQTAVSSAHRDMLIGLILDSPVVDWRSVLRYQAQLEGIRDPLAALTMGSLSSPMLARLSGMDAPISFDQLDMVARATELTVPILLLHSDDDGFVPAEASHALAQARPDLVTMPEVRGARHTKLWNYDSEAWEHAIVGWLRVLDLGENTVLDPV